MQVKIVLYQVAQVIATKLVIAIIQLVIVKMVIQALLVNFFLVLILVVIKDIVIKGCVIVNLDMEELTALKKLVPIIVLIMDYVLKIQNVYVNLVMKV
jgi:hypothetical protein